MPTSTPSNFASPLRWPSAWKDATPLRFLKGTAFSTVLIENASPIARAARDAGLEVIDSTAVPSNTRVVKGHWPGVRITRRRGREAAESGPTGAPWVDSNGWLIQLERTLHPQQAIWIECSLPEDAMTSESSEALAFADCAAYGGRWVATLEDKMAAAMLTDDPRALARWKRLVQTAEFFQRSGSWASFDPMAVVGVAADFSGPNEFLNHEVLNLTARLNQPFRILDYSQLSEKSLSGLEAVVAPDPGAPPDGIRKLLTDFASKGGLLIASPDWGAPTSAPSAQESHPRYSLYPVGKGRLAIGKESLDDPYMVSADAKVLLSSRSDLVRFWNGGALGSYLTKGEQGITLLQALNYTRRGAGDPISTWVRGSYRQAKLFLIGLSQPELLKPIPRNHGVELQLPQFDFYAAIELT